jgi:ribose-phosphate pyrophosphokinase
MIVFGLQDPTGIAWEVAKHLEKPLGKAELRDFPDGEFYLKILNDVKGKHCAIVKSVRTGDDLLQVLLLADALKENGAVAVHAVAPYLAYMRQDKKFTEGEAVSAKTVLKLLNEVADDITTVNCHFIGEAGRKMYGNVWIRNLDAMPLLVTYFKNLLDRPVVVAPDKGSLGYAKRAAEQLNCEFDHLAKKRLSGSEVAIESKKLNVRGMDVLMLDDIISTGGTIVQASRVIREWRPASINVGCVHGLFLNGIEQFKGSVDRMASTNTINSQLMKVSVARIIAEDLKSV